VDILVEWIPIREIVFATGSVDEVTTTVAYREPHSCQRRLVGDERRRVRLAST
jgi:hypothetical protein